ncbi:MAG: hypothetical protein J7J82_04360 [Staphylothermus sp.]|nr:hypothetical protein [Staphylothermus sp.]
MSQEVKIVRIRLVGRRWKTTFIEELAKTIREFFSEDVRVRLNSFLTPDTRFPITDFDVFKEAPETELEKLKKQVEELLEKHGYSARRLLTVKTVITRMVPEEGQ